MTGKFDVDKPLGKLLQKYWDDLKRNRGDRAELRRAKSVNDIILTARIPACLSAIQVLFFMNEDLIGRFRLAAVDLGLLAHVRTTTKKKILHCKWRANPGQSSANYASDVCCNETGMELFIAMIQVLHMLGNKANLHDMANSVYYWGDTSLNVNWAFAYFSDTPDTEHPSLI